MKTLTRLSKKAVEWCEFMGYDPQKIKENMKYPNFAVQMCEDKDEIKYYGVDAMYPYVLFNPFKFNVNYIE